MKKGDKVKWKDDNNIWVSEVLHSTSTLKHDFIVISHTDKYSELDSFVIMKNEIIEHYTKENDPEMWL